MYLIFKLIVCVLKLCSPIAGLYFSAESLNEQTEKCLDESWFKLNDQTCVHLSKQKLNYDQSRQYCQLNFNAHRLSIRSAEKQRSISIYLASLIKLNSEVKDDLKVWIGLNRVNLNGRSALLWDSEFDAYNRLSEEIEKINSIELKSNVSKDQIEENVAPVKEKNKTSNLIKQTDDYYRKVGLINLKESLIDSRLSELRTARDQLLNHELAFDNRFRINRVDSHFYITNRTDKWKPKFNPNSNKLYTLCELSPIENGKTRDLHCKTKWLPIYDTNSMKGEYRCIRFLRLSKPLMCEQIKNACRAELANEMKTDQSLVEKAKTAKNFKTLLSTIDILELRNLNELAHLLKFIEFESADHRNASWLIKLVNYTDFKHLFEHSPLFNDSCYQLLPKHTNHRFEREFSNEIRYEQRRIQSGKKMSHFLHEFNCNEAESEFVICSYNKFQTKIEKDEKKLITKDRSGHERSMGRMTSTSKNEITQLYGEESQTQSTEKYAQPNANRLKNSKTKILRIENKWKELNTERLEENKENIIIKQHYLDNFEMFFKLFFILIAVNLIFFVFIFLCINHHRKPDVLRAADVPSTHIHFDNYDSTLKFE